LNLYISNFKVSNELESQREFDLEYHIFLVEIKKTFDIVYLSDDFTSYNEIEEKIENSACLIAFIDKYWNSSTWKMIEYSFANQGVGNSKRIDSFNIPIFISFSKDFKNKERFLNNRNVFELTNEIEKSLEFIINTI
jgi:hypothetical protein